MIFVGSRNALIQAKVEPGTMDLIVRGEPAAPAIDHTVAVASGWAGRYEGKLAFSRRLNPVSRIRRARNRK